MALDNEFYVLADEEYLGELALSVAEEYIRFMSISPAKARSQALAQQHLEAAQYMSQEGRYESARSQWLKAAELLEDAECFSDSQDAWMRAGLAAFRAKAFVQAQEDLKQAVIKARQFNMPIELAISLSHLGMAAAKTDSEMAVVAWRESLELAKVNEIEGLISVVALNLGRTLMRIHRYSEAKIAFEDALEVAKSSEDYRSIADILNALGDIFRAQDGHEHSTDIYQEAFEAAHLAGDVGLMAQSLANLGNAFRILGDLERAEARLSSSLSFAKALGDQVGMASCHTNLGNVYAAKGEHDLAQREYMAALTLHKRLKNEGGLVGVLANLGSLRAAKGDIEGAKRFYQEALGKLGDEHARVRADLLTLLGQLEAKSGHLGQARDLFEAALMAAKQADYYASQVRLGVCQAALLLAEGSVLQALAAYENALRDIDNLESVSDRVMGWLAYADAALVAARYDLVPEVLANARALVGATVESRTQRERLDVDTMSARVAWLRQPTPEHEGVLAASQAQFTIAGRNGDAWGVALVRWDSAAPSDLPKAEIQAARDWADQHHLIPMRIEFESLLAVAQGATPELFEPWLQSLEERGLRLVWLKVARRQVLLMPEAMRHTRLIDLISKAKQLGAEAEALRLEKMLQA